MDEEQIESKNDLTNNDKKSEIKHEPIPIMFFLTCLLLAGQYFYTNF